MHATMIERPITATPELNRLRKSLGGSSSGASSIRRRSLVPHATPIARVEDVNNDEAERLSLVASERALATSTPHSSSPLPTRDSSLTSSPQKEHFQGCLKLYTENKINKDNAWNLHLIDFMSSMLRKHDSRMENLQTASTVVDASARIYSFRVDAVHHDVLKMAGGLTKAAQAKRGKKDDDLATQDDGAADGEGATQQAKKKKKRSKGAIAANPDTLNGDFDANDCIDPFFERLAATAGDVTSSNRAFNATLQVHDKTLSLILRTDEKFLETIKENIPEVIDLSHKITLPTKMLPAFRDEDQICEPFSGFSISNWDPDTEDSDRISNWVDEHRLNLSQQALAFDVNAEVEPIPQDELHNDLLDDEPLGGIESDEEADVAVAACVARLPAACVPRVTDMRPMSHADSRLEYSYSGAIVAAWAGPSHWRLCNNRASKMSNTQSTGPRLTVEGKKPARTKRQLDFTGAGLGFDSNAEQTGDYKPTQPDKIMISRKTLATGHTWNEANFKTPIDRGLEATYFLNLFLRRSVKMMKTKDLERSAKQPDPEPLTVDEPKEYDYNNDNDASYCTQNMPDADEWGNEDATAAGDVHEQAKTTESEELGDMLEPPTKVAKIFIPYAMRSKKVDMKQLKQCTWRMLVENENDKQNEEITPTTFFSVYTKLPGVLSTNMRESLSVPLALLSVLHLANERGLILEKKDDLNDFDIVGLIK